MFVYEQVPSLRPLKLNNLRLVTVSCLWFVFHKANPSNGCIVLIFWNMRGKFLPSSYIVYVKPSLEPLFINDGKCYSIRSCYPNVFFFFCFSEAGDPAFITRHGMVFGLCRFAFFFWNMLVFGFMQRVLQAWVMYFTTLNISLSLWYQISTLFLCLPSLLCMIPRIKS